MRQKNPVTNPDFLLSNDAAKELYAVAAEQPGRRGVGDAAGARRDEPLGRARAVRGASNLNHHHSSPIFLEIPAVTPYYFRVPLQLVRELAPLTRG